ncbi:MAG: ComEC family competence protein [Oscillospiraceae bacterium]|nr:ComEC family competence protein [Oscillospiraceae bacterium]
MRGIVKNKAAVVGFSYFLAAIAADFLPTVLMIAIIVLCVASALVLGVLRKSPVVALVLFSAGIGGLAFTLYDVNERQPVFEFVERVSQSGEETLIVGTVEEKSEWGFGLAIYTVKSENARLLLTAPNVYDINVGDVIEAESSLSHLRNSGIFRERDYNFSKGILFKGDADSIRLVRRGGSSFIGTGMSYIRGYNSFIKGEVMAAFPDSGAGSNISGLLCAVFTGDKSMLTAESVQDVRISGTAHFMSVSGLHMTMMVHMFMMFFGFMPFSRNRKVKFAVMLGVISVLSVFFGLSVSVNRAAIMLLIFYGGELFMRKGNVLNSLGFALLLILIARPYAVFDTGLIMSFSGTFGVGVVAPAVLKRFSVAKRGNLLKRRFVETLMVSICACVCVLPASAFFFGGISVLAPIVSVVLLPFFMIATGSLVLFSIFAFTGGLAQVFLLIAGVMSKIMNVIISFFGQFRFGYISLDYWFVSYWVVFAVAAVAAVHMIYKCGGKSLKSAGLTIAALALMICVYNFNAVNSGRTYITIYSDGVAAWVSVKQSGREVIIVTDDTPGAHREINQRIAGEKPNLIALLRSSRNYESAFQKLPAFEYVSPDSKNVTYDIDGKFMLELREDFAVLEVDGYQILFTRSANDNAVGIRADIAVVSGWALNKREFDVDLVVYVSRSIRCEYDYERSAYYEPIYLFDWGD